MGLEGTLNPCSDLDLESLLGNSLGGNFLGNSLGNNAATPLLSRKMDILSESMQGSGIANTQEVGSKFITVIEQISSVYG